MIEYNPHGINPLQLTIYGVNFYTNLIKGITTNKLLIDLTNLKMALEDNNIKRGRYCYVIRLIPAIEKELKERGVEI